MPPEISLESITICPPGAPALCARPGSCTTHACGHALLTWHIKIPRLIEIDKVGVLENSIADG
jgi:hypothetical protein